METRIWSATREVIIGDDHPTVLIGERINPTGKRKLAQALKSGDLEIIRSEAVAQAQAGADILDINVGTFSVDEVAMLPQVVRLVMNSVDIPLCLDSTNPEALEAALRVYCGKPIVNSVTAEEGSLAKVLPLVLEYGAAVIGLVQDDRGIPSNTERRVAIARKIVERAEAVGILRSDVLIDCLTVPLGADTNSALAALKAVPLVKAELGVGLILGASNVSFGLPERPLLNNTFIAMALFAGANCVIADVAKVRPTVLATDLILGRDRRARRYIEAYRQRQRPKKMQQPN